MPTTKRLILWPGDDALNARDEVLCEIEEKIDLALSEAEGTDSGWLNELVAYIHCLNGVLREAGGGHFIAKRAATWRQRTLAVYDAIPNLTEEEIRKDRQFLNSLFDDLDQLSAKS